MGPATTANACGSAGASSMDCATQLRGLYDAYVKIIGGQNVVTMQSSDFRKVEYGPGNLPQLIQHYNLLHDQCGGAGTGLPKLGVQRGGPVYLGC